MEQNLKELLIKDLCTRLPYGIMVLEDIDKEFDGGCISKLATITEIKGEKMFLTKNSLTPVTIEEIRPYLRPMSSMTEEEDKEYAEVIVKSQDCSLENSESATTMANDWLLSKGFDVRGLISKGLALEAPDGMYNLKEK